MATYNWNINALDRLTANGFVITVHYTVSTEDGNYITSNYGTVGYTQGSDTYTPYEQLTKEQVLAWVQASVDKDAIEANLQSQINLLKNPVQKSGLPW